MAKRGSNSRESNFDVTCPCCGAVLKIDASTRSIIAHTAPVKPKTFNDMEEAARAMKEQDSRRDSIFRQSVEAQKHASDLLDKKFQEAIDGCLAELPTKHPGKLATLLTHNFQTWDNVSILDA